MFCSTSESRRHGNPRLLKCRLRNIPQERLVKGLQGLIRISQHIPCRCLAFIHTQVIVAVHQTPCQSREEDAQFKIRHLWILLDDAIFIAVTIQEQQSILLTQRDTCLIENTVVQTYILTLCLRCYLHHLKRLQRDAIRLCKSHHIRNQHRRTRRQSSHRQTSLNHSLNTLRKFKPLLQRILRTPSIITPMMLLHLRRSRDVKIHLTLKRPRSQMHFTIFLYIEPKVHTLVNGKTRHQSMLVIHMCPQRTHPIRRKDMILIFHGRFEN